MDQKKAKALGALLKSSIGEVPFIEAVPPTSPFWSHKWLKGKKHGPAVRVTADNGLPALLLVTVEWLPGTRKGDWYLIGVSEADLGTTEIELHHVDPTGDDLIWKYSPKRQDGKNEKRMALFAAKYPHREVCVTIPTSVEAVPLLVEELQELIGDRRRADDLTPLHGAALGSPVKDIDEGFPEGAAHHRYIVHRHRERRLRKAKIAEVLKRKGRLACEVPGCEFDFKESYGDLGNGFAHVHHKIPLSSLKSVRNTKLDDLAIVCANCHAMIHVGGESRELDEVTPKNASGMEARRVACR